MVTGRGEGGVGSDRNMMDERGTVWRNEVGGQKRGEASWGRG